jgi:hypothetical protein
LQEHVGTFQAASCEFAAEAVSGFGGRFEFFGRPEMGTAFKEADVYSVKFEHGDQVQDAVVGEQGKSEISAGEFEARVHRGNMAKKWVAKR